MQFVMIYGFVQSNIQHVSPASGGAAPRPSPGLCPWTPLGTSVPQIPHLSPLSKFLAMTLLNVIIIILLSTLYWYLCNTTATSCYRPRGQSSPGSLQSGQQASNCMRHMPQLSSLATHLHTATAVILYAYNKLSIDNKNILTMNKHKYHHTITELQLTKIIQHYENNINILIKVTKSIWTLISTQQNVSL